MEKTVNIGKRISECRQNKHMSQEEMANRIGVTPQAVPKWERGQSLPDVALLADICFVLGVSADYLLGLQGGKMTENGDAAEQEIILHNLRHCLEPLELVIGMNLVSLFTDNAFVEQIKNIRRECAKQGILVPVVRVKDETAVGENGFQIMSYRKVLYEEKLNEISENSLKYMMEKLRETICSNYAFILNPDLVKKLVDNLQSAYPATIQDVVPEKISYGMLTEVLRSMLVRRKVMPYLLLIIEQLENILREQPELNIEALTEAVLIRMIESYII